MTQTGAKLREKFKVHPAALRESSRVFVSVLIVFTILALYPIANGYPLTFPDMWDYAAGGCITSIRSPTLGCATALPVRLWGVWGYVLCQSLVASILLVLLSRRLTGSPNVAMLIAASILSAFGLYSGWVMADAWAPLGLLGLFLVLSGLGSGAIVLVFLAFCVSVHYGNFPLFVLAAGTYALLRQSETRPLLRSLCAVGLAFLFVLVGNWLGGERRFSSPSSYSWLASRMLSDVPEALDLKCNQQPDFSLCPFRDDARKSAGTAQGRIFWTIRGSGKITDSEFEAASRQFAFFSAYNYPVENLVAGLSNTVSQLAAFDVSDGFRARIDPESYPLKGLLVKQPADELAFKRAFQSTGGLYQLLTSLRTLHAVVYWLALLVCATGAFFTLGRTFGFAKARSSDRLQVLCALGTFSLIALVINAGLMGNLSGIYPRYQTRLGLLPVLSAMWLIQAWMHTLPKPFNLVHHFPRRASARGGPYVKNETASTTQAKGTSEHRQSHPSTSLRVDA